jgi:methionine synthase II (cobalamin-independent)
MAGLVAPDRILLAPSAGLEFLPHGVARRKLRALVQGARAAEADLKGARA